MDKSRAQFEEYLKNKFGNKKSLYVKFLTNPNSAGGFQSNHSQLLWDAWQASRAAIEIELPDTAEKRWFSSWHGLFRCEAFWLEVKKSIASHGLRVKK